MTYRYTLATARALSSAPSLPMLHVVSARSRRRRAFIYLLAAIVAACGLFIGESDAEAQSYVVIDWSGGPSSQAYLISVSLLISGLAVAPLTLDIVQGAQLARRGHTSLGATVPNLVFSTLELTLGALVVGEFSQSSIHDGPWVAAGICGILHAASSIAWSIYGLTRTRPPAGVGSTAKADRTIFHPAPTLLWTPSGTAPGLTLGGSF